MSKLYLEEVYLPKSNIAFITTHRILLCLLLHVSGLSFFRRRHGGTVTRGLMTIQLLPWPSLPPTPSPYPRQQQQQQRRRVVVVAAQRMTAWLLGFALACCLTLMRSQGERWREAGTW
jgi:hypothetical protein